MARQQDASNSRKPVSVQKRRSFDRRAYVPHYLVVLANGFAFRQSRIYLKHLGLGLNECRILTVIAQKPGLAAQELGEILMMNKSIVSRSLQVLQERALIEPPVGRRSRPLRLTAEGYAAQDRVVEVAIKREKRLMKGFSAAEKEVLLGYFSRMLENLKVTNNYDPLRADPTRTEAAGQGEAVGGDI